MDGWSRAGQSLIHFSVLLCVIIPIHRLEIDTLPPNMSSNIQSNHDFHFVYLSLFSTNPPLSCTSQCRWLHVATRVRLKNLSYSDQFGFLVQFRKPYCLQRVCHSSQSRYTSQKLHTNSYNNINILQLAFSVKAILIINKSKSKFYSANKATTFFFLKPCYFHGEKNDVARSQLKLYWYLVSLHCQSGQIQVVQVCCNHMLFPQFLTTLPKGA